MRLLLVEDNEMNRDMLTRRLVRHGFDVECACDGEEGVRMTGELMPDVVLMDMGLPVMDGWQAIRELRADPRTKAIPIIALTAHALADDRQQALALGCADFIAKPIDLPLLLDAIRRHQPARSTESTGPRDFSG